MNRGRTVRFATLLALALGGCAAPSAAPTTVVDPSARHVELTVLGAASLKDVLAAVAEAYASVDATVSIVISTDSSAALETQIEQGAPADVFLSADTRHPQALLDEGLAMEPLVVFAANELAIIVPADNPAGITSPADLARHGIDVIAAGDEVPISGYARMLVENLARQPGYPADFAASYAANVASREDNVKAILGKVELGQGDAGIVYATDAAATSGVTTIDIPAGANVPATYGGVVVASSRDEEAAKAFLAWLAGRDGSSVLAGFGFLPPP